MPPRTKIARELGDAALETFLEDLRAETGLTVRRLQEIAASRGIAISHQGAANFLNSEYQPYLERLRKARDLAVSLEEFDGSGDSGKIADRAASHLSRLVFDLLMDYETLDADPTERSKFLDRAGSVLRSLRSGDVQRDALNLRIRQLEEEKAEREKREKEAREQLLKAKERGGLSDEGRAIIEQALKML